MNIKQRFTLIFIFLFLFMPFSSLFYHLSSPSSFDNVSQAPLLTLDQSWDSKDEIIGTGNNVTVDLFFENATSYSNFLIQNAFLSFDHKRIIVLPQIPGYKIYKATVAIDSETNFTAVTDYFAVENGTATSTTIQRRITGFEPQMAGQKFNLAYRSAFYNASIYMAISGLNNQNNGTIRLYNDSTKTSVLHSQEIPIVSLGSAVWHTYDYNLILNDTSKSYELILNGTDIGSTGRSYYWYHPTAGASALDGEVKLWDTSWAPANFDHTLVYCYLPLADTGILPRNFTANEVDLKVNDTLVGADNYLEVQADGITHLEFTTNISCNVNGMNVRIFYIQEDQEARTSYIGSVNQPQINWNVTITNAFISEGIDGTYGINTTLPSDWIVNNILNGTSLGVYDESNWIQLNQFVSIRNASPGSDPWILNCSAPNYLNQISVEKEITPGTYLNITDSLTVNIMDTIRVNGTLISADINSGDSNLTIFDFTDVANYSQVEEINPPVNGEITFNAWDISQNATSNGTYTIQMIWYNGTEVGIKNILLEVIHHTDSVLIIDDEIQITHDPELYWFIGTDNIINVTVFYNRTFQPTGISTPNATYSILNETGGLWQSWTPLSNEILGTGFYNVSLDITSWVYGKYFIGINLNLSGYLTQSHNITLNLVYNTSITLLQPLSSTLSSFYPENLTIAVDFSRIGVGTIPDATVQYYINESGPSPIAFNGSTYAIQLNSTDYGIGNYNITIFASKIGHFSRQIDINWTVQVCPTQIQHTVNGSYSTYEFYHDEIMKFTITYTDTEHNVAVDNALVNLTIAGYTLVPITLTPEGNGDYSTIINSSTGAAGLWPMSFLIQKPNYETHTLDLNIYTRHNTTLTWFIPPPSEIRPGDELILAVNL
ncbi:MAG: hypothetical protein ACTSQI_19685, partial [Candidatus Helarchaeota archaeon]